MNDDLDRKIKRARMVKILAPYALTIFGAAWIVFLEKLPAIEFIWVGMIVLNVTLFTGLAASKLEELRLRSFTDRVRTDMEGMTTQMEGITATLKNRLEPDVIQNLTRAMEPLTQTIENEMADRKRGGRPATQLTDDDLAQLDAAQTAYDGGWKAFNGYCKTHNLSESTMRDRIRRYAPQLAEWRARNKPPGGIVA